MLPLQNLQAGSRISGACSYRTCACGTLYAGGSWVGIIIIIIIVPGFRPVQTAGLTPVGSSGQPTDR